MAEINGGSLKYTAEMDVSGLKSAVNEGNKVINGFSDVVGKLGDNIDDAFGSTTENIKIQKQVILDLESQYKELQKQIEKVAPGRVQLGFMGEAAEIAKEIELEKKALVELESFVKSNKETHESLRQKLSAVKNEMQDLVSAGQRDSAQYEELSKNADEYQKSIDEVNGTMKALSGNTGLNALVQTLGLASGGLAVFQGLTALTAGENERLDQIMVKLQSTMSIAIGIQQLQNSLQKESGIIQSVMALQAMARARAEALATKNTIASTVAQRIFNAVAKANPYVLLATALVTVVGALVLFSSKTKKAVEDQNAINKSTAEGASESIVKYKQLQTQWNALANDFKGKQKFISDNKDKFHELGVEVENVGEAEKFLVSQSDTFIQSLMLRAEAAARAQIAVEKYKEAILKDKEIEEFDKDWKEAGFFGKIGLGAKAVFSGMDDKAGDKLKSDAEDQLRKEADLIKKADELRDQSAKQFIQKDKERKEKTKKTPKQVAEEYFPPGSVAEIQKRLAEIDKALSKATGDKQIADLKNKRIAIAKELAEAEKKIQILSLQEQFDQSNKLWEAYYSTVESLGKNVADRIYGDLLKNDSSQFDALVKLQQELSEKAIKGTITTQEAEVYDQVTKSIDGMLGKQSALDKFNSDIEFSLSKLTTASERLLFLQSEQDKLSADDKANGKFASIEEFRRNEIDEQKAQYQNLLSEHESYENKRNEIAKQASDKRIQILNDENLTPEKKAQLTESVTNQANQQTSDVALDELANSSAWQMLYQNIDSLSAYQIEKLLRVLEEKAPELTKAMTPTDFSKVVASFRSARQKLTEANPFRGFALAFQNALKPIPAETEDVVGAVENNFEDLRNAASGVFSVIKGTSEQLGPVKDILGETGAEALDVIQNIAMAAIGILQAVETASATTAAGIKSAETSSVILLILQAIILAVKAIISLFRIFSGDRKKEKAIKGWKNEVEGLKTAYDELTRSVEKSMGEAYYQSQIKVIENLKQQQALLIQMRDAEASKKKADEGKIAEFNQQIQDNNNKIEDIIESMSKSIAQTDAKALANQLADALIEAYGKGEDAATAYGKVADNVMRDAVKNALKMQFLEKPMQDMIKQLIKNMGFNADGSGSFDGLTDAEREQLKAMMANASNNYMQALGAYSDLFGESAMNASSLSGAIKGVSEETASVLAGQMNAMRIMQAEALKVHQDSNTVLRLSLTSLTQIEINTRYNKYLELIYWGMKDKGILRGIGKV